LFQDFPFFDYIILPMLIFLARMTDTSMSTLRIVMISKGRRRETRIIGFFEVLIWLVAVGQIMKNLNNVMCYLAWAGGFTAGSYNGPVKVVELVVERQYLKPVGALIEQHLPNAFTTTSDVVKTSSGVFTARNNSINLRRLFLPLGKR